jgi:predicted PurR-regulated permease PerM
MGIQSIIGDVKSGVNNNVSAILNSAWGAVSGQADRIGTYVANVYSGGFAGVSNFDNLYDAIRKYAENTRDIIAKYDANTDIEDTFKGEVAQAIPQFVKETQSLLEAYVTIVEKWKDELADVYQRYQQGSQNLSQNISQDAQDVRQQTQRIMDDSGPSTGPSAGGSVDIG